MLLKRYISELRPCKNSDHYDQNGYIRNLADSLPNLLLAIISSLYIQNNQTFSIKFSSYRFIYISILSISISD